MCSSDLLLLPNLVDQRLVGPERRHRRDSIAGIKRQISGDAIAREKALRILRQARYDTDVGMKIDHSRHHIFAGEIPDSRAWRNLHLRRRSHPRNAPVGYDHPRIALRRAITNQGEALKRGDFGSIKRNDEQSQQESFHQASLPGALPGFFEDADGA